MYLASSEIVKKYTFFNYFNKYIYYCKDMINSLQGHMDSSRPQTALSPVIVVALTK